MSPEFSVILPSRGDCLHFRQALASALACAGDLEVVVGHDRREGEAAFRPETIRDPRVRVIEADRTGPAAARNAAMADSHGRLLAFLDDDDLWLPDHLRRSASILDEHPEAMGVAFDAWLFRDESPDGSGAPPTASAELPRFAPAGMRRRITLRELLLANPILTPTVVLRRERLDSTDPFDESLPVMEDYDFWLRLAVRHTLLFDPEPAALVRRRKHGASRELRLMADASLRILTRIRSAKDLEPALSPAEWRRRLGRLHHDLAYAYLADGLARDARCAARESIRNLPFLAKNYVYVLATYLPGPARRKLFASDRARLPGVAREGPAES